MDATQELTQETIREFVGAAHGDLATVKRLYTETPSLLNARYLEWDETALEAASHMGAREIALFLLDRGVALTPCAAAMLGKRDALEAFLTIDPAVANSHGAHRIPILYHAAMSGDTVITDLLLAHGSKEGINMALHGAVLYGHAEMVRWLLEHGANEVNTTDWQDKTPLKVAIERGFDKIAALLRAHGGTE